MKGQLGHKLVEYPTSTQLQRLLSLSRRLRLLRVTEMQMPHEMCFFQNDPTPPLNTHSGFLKRNGRTMTREISRDARGRVSTRDGGGVDIRVSLSLDRVPQVASSRISPILCHFGWKGKVLRLSKCSLSDTFHISQFINLLHESYYDDDEYASA